MVEKEGVHQDRGLPGPGAGVRRPPSINFIESSIKRAVKQKTIRRWSRKKLCLKEVWLPPPGTAAAPLPTEKLKGVARDPRARAPGVCYRLQAAAAKGLSQRPQHHADRQASGSQ